MERGLLYYLLAVFLWFSVFSALAIECKAAMALVKLKNHLSPVNFNTHFLWRQLSLAKIATQSRKEAQLDKSEKQLKYVMQAIIITYSTSSEIPTDPADPPDIPEK